MDLQKYASRLIFGLKLRELRRQNEKTYQELSDVTGLSVSYLSEIESGKKYPKPDKIQSIAKGLDISERELVSDELPKKLHVISDLLRSKFIQEFPLEDFGFSLPRLVEAITTQPDKASAFLTTIIQLANEYKLGYEKFYMEALRSYVELVNNHFPELENLVSELHMEFMELGQVPFDNQTLEQILLAIGVKTDYQSMQDDPALRDVRSIFIPGRRTLSLNPTLMNGQKNFLMGKEIAFQWLKIKERSLATPWVHEHNFNTLLNDYRASYFSAALIMPIKAFRPKVEEFFNQKLWDPDKFIKLMRDFNSTPEMMMQRLTSILPHEFKLKQLFFLRFVKTRKSYALTKELHLGEKHSPGANERNEHYCRRWLGVNIIEDYEDHQSTGLLAKAQRSRFHHSGNQYFALSIAFRNVSYPEEIISVTIGFRMDDKLDQKIAFVNDAKISDKVVNQTCERCEISDCEVRASVPRVLESEKEKQTILTAVDNLINQKKAPQVTKGLQL